MLKFPNPEPYYDKVTKICVFIFAFVVPVLVISACYGLMILRLKSVRLLSGSKEKDKNLRRITRMVLVVVAAFIICWTPIHIFIIIKAFIEIDQKNPLVIISWHLCIALGYMNSSLNPVLYAFLDENFKRCFREFCLPFRAHMEQSTFSQGHNTTREPTSVCGTVASARNPTWLVLVQGSPGRPKRNQQALQSECTQISTTEFWVNLYKIFKMITQLKLNSHKPTWIKWSEEFRLKEI